MILNISRCVTLLEALSSLHDNKEEVESTEWAIHSTNLSFRLLKALINISVNDPKSN